MKADIINGGVGDSITWSSSKPDVATINPSTGLLTGVKGGDTVITATYTSGSQMVSSISDTVVIKVKATEVTMKIDKIYKGLAQSTTPVQLSATVKLDGNESTAESAKVTWECRDVAGTNVASITPDGKLTVKGKGGDEFRVTATYTYVAEGITKTDSFKCTVTAQNLQIIPR